MHIAMLVFRTCFHLSPLLPLYYGKYALAGAIFFLVVAAYVKTFKLNSELNQYAEANAQLPDKSLVRARNFWRTLTFLPQTKVP